MSRKEQQDVIPLFMTQVKGKLQPAIPKVTEGKDSYKVSTFISSIAVEVETAVDELTAGKRAGEMTLAAYVLLESLHRTGLQNLADVIMDSPEALRQAALCCAIGLEAGRQIPEEVKIVTAESASDIGLRDLTNKHDEKEDVEPPTGD